MNSLPIVLVPACNRMLGEHPFHVAGRKYVQAVRLAGALPLVIPRAEPVEFETLLALADGVLLTGSPSNVDPRHFGEAVHDASLPLDPERDAWTLALVPQLLERGIPLLAICRGAQEVNVALGGRLHQAVQEVGDFDDHRSDDELPAEQQYGPAHPLQPVAGGLLAGIVGNAAFEVNSIHGQGVAVLAPGLRAEAHAPDGLIEAFTSPGAAGFNLCVQWHPEWRASDNPVSMRILDAFGQAVRAYRDRVRGPLPGVAPPPAAQPSVQPTGSFMTARKNMTFNQLEQWLDQNRVTELECLVPDLTGVARGKILPRQKFTEDRGMRLPEAVVAMGVTGEFPTEGPYYDVIDATDRDMHLRPDPSTARIVPWATDPTAQIIHDCYDRDGRLIPFAPRSVLRRVCDLYAQAGWDPVVAPELEFYLVARNSDPDVPLKPPIGRSGRSETSRQAYSIDAVNEFDPLFEDVYAYCEQMELNVDTLIHEIGAGQMEINFFHAHPLGLADEVFLFKRTVREAALRHDMFATFMAKPIAGEPGSAMHVHQSIVDSKTGRNIFSNEDGSPTREFFWYIGGLQKYVPAAMALFAPYVNSYRRLARFTAAPINIQWGTDNRTVGIRSPLAAPAARRVENRVIGADANPYVALAATLACGWLGMQNRIEPSPECTGDAYLGEYALPRSLGQALELLRGEADLAAVLGKEFITVYTEVKEIEQDEFMKVISPWEREHLLLHV